MSITAMRLVTVYMVTKSLHRMFLFRTAKRDNPRWYMVDVKFKRMTRRFVSLAEMKALHAEHKQSGGPLRNISLFTRARLSVQPISQGGTCENAKLFIKTIIVYVVVNEGIEKRRCSIH